MSRFTRHECCAGAARGRFALPGTPRQYARSLPFQFRHIALTLRIRLETRSVEGSATIEFDRANADANTLCLDGLAFDIRKVELDTGKGLAAAQYDYDGERFEIHVGTKAQSGRVRISYRAQPRAGLYFLAPDETVPDRPLQVWSQCQDEDARNWFPCHDKPQVKTSAEFKITVPSQFSVLCNGNLIAERNIKKTAGKRGKKSEQLKSFHYKLEETLPSYLFTLVVGEFDKIEDRAAVLGSGREVPVSYWVPKGRKEDAKRAFSRTPEMIELFSKLTGTEFPFQRYTQVVVSDFIFGGMENTTATTMYEHILLDERAALDINSHDLVAHELAHQWFGDWVTCRDWPHAWLNEGFATYFEQVEREHRLGRDEYLVGIENDLKAYLSEASSRYTRAIVSKEYAEPIDLFDRHLYEKGGLGLHLLRQRLGDETFWRAICRYLSAHGAGHAMTDELQRTLESESGVSLDRFFDEWLYRAGHPSLKVKATFSAGQLTVRFEQTQKSGPMELMFEVEVLDDAGKLHRLSARGDEKHTSLGLRLPRRPRYVCVDPNLLLLGQVQLDLPTDWLRNQLTTGHSVRARRQAAQCMGTKLDFRGAALLGETLGREQEAWPVRSACADALGRLGTRDALDALCSQTAVEAPKVRAAVAEALGRFTQSAAVTALQKMLSKEPSYLVQASATRSLGQTRAAEARKTLLAQLKTRSWADVVACAAVDGLAELRSPVQVDELLKQTHYGIPTRVRRHAVLALGKVAEGRAVLRQLVDHLDDPHPHFRADVATALTTLGDAQAVPALRKRLARETDGRVSRKLKEACNRLRASTKPNPFEDRVTQLERELLELKGKLSELSVKDKPAKAAGAGKLRRTKNARKP